VLTEAPPEPKATHRATLALGITTERPGRKPETVAYRLQPVPAGPDEDAAFLVSHAGKSYRCAQVRHRHNGSWYSCTCPAARFGDGPCKHGLGLVEVGLFKPEEVLNRLRRLPHLDSLDPTE
jgi:hypothetical protein